MTNKHTPGPWISFQNSIKKDMTVIGLTSDAGVTIGCVMGGKTSGPHFVENEEEKEANVCLISAAPELLAALVKMEREKSDYMIRNNLGDPSRETTNKIARAAIAKATGS